MALLSCPFGELHLLTFRMAAMCIKLTFLFGGCLLFVELAGDGSWAYNLNFMQVSWRVAWLRLLPHPQTGTQGRDPFYEDALRGL